LLYERSLRSVYEQEGVSPLEIVIVDDNPIQLGEEYSKEYKKIKEVINRLRLEIVKDKYDKQIDFYKEKTLFENCFKTTLLKNVRTKGHSGTGAWNTTIFYLSKKYKNLKNMFIAILDDDDAYKQSYLFKCIDIIRKRGNHLAAIFPYIEWRKKEEIMMFRFTKEDLTQRAFFIGNLGIQGSNMCIRGDILIDIGGFDEALYSATDRDLMIRFLDYLDLHPEADIEIIPEHLVVHYVNRDDRITDNKTLKKLGLDVFYKKYKHRFSEEDFNKSLERARKLFGYEYIK